MIPPAMLMECSSTSLATGDVAPVTTTSVVDCNLTYAAVLEHGERARITPSSLPASVIKRDGTRAAFELAKIASAIARAGTATGEFDGNEAARLATQVGRVVAHRFSGAAPQIESIQ